MVLDYIGAHVATELGWLPQPSDTMIVLKNSEIEKNEFDRSMRIFQELSDLLLEAMKKEGD